MATTRRKTVVNIRPEVSVLSVFPHLNYKAWFAMAEFVDNAVQSFLAHRSYIQTYDGNNVKLKVSIEVSGIDGGKIVVRDNAAGIHEHDYERAFKTAAVPADRSGLSEFGVGMKSAACWFARNWSVRTSALGEDIERTIHFDVASIVRQGIENVTPTEIATSPGVHYTELVLRNLHTVPQTKTVAKIKEHLSSIYRIFIREGILELRFNGDILTYSPPKILTAPWHKQEQSHPMRWHKEIDISFEDGRRVHGFAALRETASTSSSGFALFRRNRLIQGSGDDGYRPEVIFKKANSFTYQRLFGELHVEGFDVSHTKDGIQWAEYEEVVLEKLKSALNQQPVPLLEQAEGHRVRPKPADLQQGARTALETTANALTRGVIQVVEQQISTPPPDIEVPLQLSETSEKTERIIELEFNELFWRVTIELTTDPSIGDWLDIADEVTTSTSLQGKAIRNLSIRLALAHPFMDRFSGAEPEKIEPLLRVAVALALAEVTAREGGVKKAISIRLHLNDLLRTVLSKP
jgi:Histidine kinase-, DNA gyrase B-, and HSP90-like ATPase